MACNRVAVVEEKAAMTISGLEALVVEAEQAKEEAERARDEADNMVEALQDSVLYYHDLAEGLKSQPTTTSSTTMAATSTTPTCHSHKIKNAPSTTTHGYYIHCRRCRHVGGEAQDDDG